MCGRCGRHHSEETLADYFSVRVKGLPGRFACRDRCFAWVRLICVCHLTLNAAFLKSLEQSGHALSATYAHGDDAVLGVTAVHFREEVRGDAGTGRTEGMP